MGCNCSRHVTDKHIASSDHELEQMAIIALFRAWRRRVRLRTVQLACTLVSRPVQQLSLFQRVNRKTTTAKGVERGR